MKKLFTLFLALTLALTLAPFAFADTASDMPTPILSAVWSDPTQELTVTLDDSPFSLSVYYGTDDWMDATEDADYLVSDTSITLLPELITDDSGESWPAGTYLLSVGVEDTSQMLVLTIKGPATGPGTVVYEDDRISMTYTCTDEAGVHFDLVNQSDVEISILFDTIAINGRSYDLSSGDYGSTSIMAQSTGEIIQNINEDYDLDVSTLGAAFRYGATEDPDDEADGSFSGVEVSAVS